MSRQRIYSDEERKERMREAVRRYRIKNKDKVNAQHKKYYETHKQLYKEARRKKYEKQKQAKLETKNAIKEAVNIIQWVQEYIQAIGEEHKDVYVEGLEEAMNLLTGKKPKEGEQGE